MMDKGWVVVNEADPDTGKHQQYLGVDTYSGGYYYWSNFLTQAKIFETLAEAIQLVTEDSDFTGRMGKQERIPRLVHSASGVNITKRRGEATITVRPIGLGDREWYRTYLVSLDKSETNALYSGIAYVKEEHWFVEIAGKEFPLLNTYHNLYQGHNNNSKIECTLSDSDNTATFVRLV